VIAAAVSISSTNWVLPLTLIGFVFALIVVSSYWRTPGNGRARAIATVLRLVGLAALFVCLLEPLWSRSRAKPGANFFVVLADNSAGMKIKDRGAEKDRAADVTGLLAREDWQTTLAETFSLARYSFDRQIQRLEREDHLDFNGSATALADALRTLKERFHGQPLAGVLVISDGNATDVEGDIDTARLPPIYPVLIGRDDVERDVSLQKVAVSQTAFEDAPVTIQADVETAGFRGEDVVIQLIDPNGRVVNEQVRPAQQGKPLSARFSVKPPTRGISFYTVRAGARGDLAALTNGAIASSEATLANNSRMLAVDRGSAPHRILYVAGRPNWEFKFLNRALAEDEQVQLVALMRIAKREPKFEFIGRRGETGNPLFRGFGKNDEETERYDQPVLVRLNTRDEFELKGGFPKAAEDLYGYDAIIIDDLESEFFTRDQMMLAQKFVSERGGALLMLGGAESFRDGKYPRTPIGDMLPIYLDRDVALSPAPHKFVLTREGWLQPWLRLRDNEAAERTRISAVPSFDVLNNAAEVKPGASVLATVSDAQGAAHPALVAQRFGNGRTAALLVGDMWKWGLRDEAMHRDMDKAWRQMMRWLVTDVPAPVQLQAREQAGVVNLEVTARDKEFRPLDGASVQLFVTSGGRTTRSTNSIGLLAESSPKQPGVYTASYIPRQPGAYHAEAIVRDANGAELGRAEAGWTSDPAAEEFRSLKPNRALLEKLARQTGGEIVSAESLNRFVQSLPNRRAPITEMYSQPLWHTSAMFLFALACFVGEWGVRRWKGLP
jgi:uncharacterized membrane protein